MKLIEAAIILDLSPEQLKLRAKRGIYPAIPRVGKSYAVTPAWVKVVEQIENNRKGGISVSGKCGANITEE